MEAISSEDEQHMERHIEQDNLQQMSADLADAQEKIKSLEMRQAIDQQLTEQETIDLEVSRLLTECAVNLMEEPDIKEAVSTLKRKKPYLFRGVGFALGGAMGRHQPAHRHDQIKASADKAKQTGNRRDLLSYLRSKR